MIYADKFDDGDEPQTASEVFLHAARYIERFGYCKAMGKRGGPRSVFGAITNTLATEASTMRFAHECGVIMRDMLGMDAQSWGVLHCGSREQAIDVLVAAAYWTVKKNT